MIAKQLRMRRVSSVQRCANLFFKASEVQKPDLKGHASDGGSIKLLLTIRGKSHLVTAKRENQMSSSPVTMLSLRRATKGAFSTHLAAVFIFNRNLTLDCVWQIRYDRDIQVPASVSLIASLFWESAVC